MDALKEQGTITFFKPGSLGFNLLWKTLNNYLVGSRFI